MSGITVYFAEVYRKDGGDGAFLLDASHSPSAVTDQTGRFALINIPAREYVMVVGDPYSKNFVVPDETGKPKVFTAVADKLVDIGQVAVKLEP